MTQGATRTVCDAISHGPILRLKVTIRGAVQGVGFRPFIYRLASELRLNGWVSNSSQGVFVEVEGQEPVLREFLLRVEREKPAISSIQSLESSFVDATGFVGFDIRPSMHGEKTALVMPDIASCPDCLREIFDPSNRRYRYPFTNCTNCGPRYTIIESLPYDRPGTTMKNFPMCPACQAEYTDPLDRRFHAQPNACPVCGPQLELWSTSAAVIAKQHDALELACQAIRDGQVVAVKGLGGFHLMVDARNEIAVRLLRERKRREEKPFALMYSSIRAIRDVCEMDELEERLLHSPESPIVLLERSEEFSSISSEIAPNNPYLGVMLPYTPLHHLMMSELQFPVVATSGNLSDEPICIDELEAIKRLGSIADIFLVHNRPIVRHVDDSIARIVLGRELVLRRARGFAPLPVTLADDAPPVLAVGAHQKNTVAIAVGKQLFISQHIGDLETTEAYKAFTSVIQSFEKLYEFTPATVACDLHPNYVSSVYAKNSQTKVVGVQHHYAHVLACMAENSINAPVLGVSWDGSGYGPDNTIWGGEFLAINETGFTRVAHLRTFRLPGSERAVKEPRRSAVGLLYEIFGQRIFEQEDLACVQACTPEERKVLGSMLGRALNSPVTSSAGRLYDALAAIIGLRQVVGFEGQAAMELEFRATEVDCDESYSVHLGETNPAVLNWAPMILEVIDDVRSAVPVPTISRKFHNTLAEMILAVAQRVNRERVALTGGCFQNKLLTELTVRRLQEVGFSVYWHQRIPPNDGGIAVGQVMAAIRAAALQ